VVPAFAEEMNRCRAMVKLQAEQWATLGYGTLVVDPFGTGDSAGEFVDATWEQWQEDLRLGADWLQHQGLGCQTLWGLRLGAVMAAQLAAEMPQVRRLVFWQPVVAGKLYWTQFLRIRIAAEMGQPGGVKTTEELRQRALRDEAVEVGGYDVGAALARRIDTLLMPDATALLGRQLQWFEVLADADAVVPRANAKLIESLQAQGVAVQLVQVTGPAFWQVHERDVAPELVAATTQLAHAWEDGPVQQVAPQVRPHSAAWPECPVAFACAQTELAGVLHKGTPEATVGVVVVVAGGPQYRAGAHRQFVALARMLASHGYPVLRFDLRGMGDSGGSYVGYHHSRPDIRAAVDALQALVPSVRQVMLFGECESASGILFYAYQDSRVHKVALANPWVRTEEGRAEVMLKHYYRDRLLSRQFWGDMARGKLRVGRAAASFVNLVLTVLRGRKALRAGVSVAAEDGLDGLPLVAKTAEGLRRFQGRAILLMSGKDYIAREFDEVTKSSKAWAGLLSGPRIRRADIEGADHTFSRTEWKAEVHQVLRDWLVAD
jgi:exosortase A-associated hydrolase 1/exosortase A-associated hydrolase 2